MCVMVVRVKVMLELGRWARAASGGSLVLVVTPGAGSIGEWDDAEASSWHCWICRPLLE